MAGAAGATSFNPSNLWSDLEVLSTARKDETKHTVYLYNGKLSYQSFQTDKRESSKSWTGWMASSLGHVTEAANATFSAVDYESEHVADYIEKLTDHVVRKLNVSELDRKQVAVLGDVAKNSLTSLADEYSVKPETRAEAGKGQFNMGLNLAGNGRFAMQLQECAVRISKFING